MARPGRPTPPRYWKNTNVYKSTIGKDGVASYNSRIRHKRFVSELIGLGMQGISAYLEYRKTTRFEQGLQQLMKHTRLQDKEIKALRKDMMSLTKATLHDLKEDTT